MDLYPRSTMVYLSVYVCLSISSLPLSTVICLSLFCAVCWSVFLSLSLSLSFSPSMFPSLPMYVDPSRLPHLH